MIRKGKLELSEPFKSRWRSGYVVINSQNRRNVCLVNSKTDRTTVSYARYIMSVSLGRFLADDEHVDHIDEDKTNDALENLQILSPENNNRKTHKIGETLVDFTCPVCNKFFQLTKRQSHKKQPYML